MARQISANEDQTDSYEDRLGTYLVRLVKGRHTAVSKLLVR